MTRRKIIPVILSGGAGTRLWPLSREHAPKQLLNLVATDSLIQATAQRADARHGFSPPIVVAGSVHGEEIERQLEAIGVPAEQLILEPTGRNTAPAIALAALAAREADPEALILVMPSDHVISRPEVFRAAVAAAAGHAEDGWLVTFGVTPDRPETGYGYIEAADELAPGVRKVARFVEKPDLETAETYLKSGRHFWNAGIFLMRASAYLDALRAYAPGIAGAAERAYGTARRGGAYVLPTLEAFAACPSDSIDYAVMEKAEKVAVAPVDMGWSDIGAFGALWEQLERDETGNAIQGDVIAEDTRNCLLRSEGPLLAAVGVSDLTVVATDDAVLVLPHERAQEVKRIVEHLKRASRPELERAPATRERWGRRRLVAEGEDVSAQLYRIEAGCTADVPAGTVTLVGGEATLAGRALEPGTPVTVAEAGAVSATGEKAAQLLVTARRSTS